MKFKRYTHFGIKVWFEVTDRKLDTLLNENSGNWLKQRLKLEHGKDKGCKLYRKRLKC